jgi:hypothetical protein
MSSYKMRFGAVLLLATGLPISAYAKCGDFKICWALPIGHCDIYHNVCKEVPPQGSAQNKYSIEVLDLSREELQKTMDFLATQDLLGGVNKSTIQIPSEPH